MSVAELTDDELTDACAVECCGFYHRTPEGTAWHNKGELVFTAKAWRPLSDWHQTMLVKDATERISKIVIKFTSCCGFPEPTAWGGDNFSHPNIQRAVLLACLAAARAKKGTVTT